MAKVKLASIPIKDLAPDRLAIIANWPGKSVYTGLIVQRTASHLICIGEHTPASWPDLFASDVVLGDEFRVNVLPRGTVLEI